MSIAVSPSIVGGTLNLYKYEFFSYVFTIASPTPDLSLQSTRSTSLQGYLTQVSPTQINFTGTPLVSSASPFLLIIDLVSTFLTNPVSTQTYNVFILNGRIQTFPPSPFPLVQYENISNTLGSIIQLTPSTAVDSIVSSPTLPFGLIVSPDLTSITGTPMFLQSQKSYQLIGSNSTNGRIVTSTIAISVGVPAVRLSPPVASFTGLTTTSTPMVTFTALVPNTIYSTTFYYLWSQSLPSGLKFTDINGVEKPYGPAFSPTDPNKTIKLTGTPDMTDALGFPASGVVTIVLTGYYKNATNVETTGTATLRLEFARTVLMTAFASTALFVGKQLVEPTDVVITAATYFFPLGSPIVSIVSSGLPAGLTLISSTSSSYFLRGKPTTAGTAVYTFTATNSYGDTKSISLPITINPNTVNFQQATDQAFIVSRPISSITFSATSTSGSTVTYSSSIDFATYGLAFTPVGRTIVLSGVPTSALPATPVTIFGTDTLGAVGSTTFSLTISPDVFTFPTFPVSPFAFFQNRPITPYQFVVTTLSGRPIQSFTSTNLPPGLILTPSGLLTGTPTAVPPVSPTPTFTITATTGYQPPPGPPAGLGPSRTYSYSVKADNFLLLQENGVDAIGLVFSNIQFRSIQYSTNRFVNPIYTFADLYPPEYPAPVLTLTPAGLFSADFSGGPVFPTYLANFTAAASGVTTSSPIVFTFSNTQTPLLVAGYGGEVGSTSNAGQLRTTSSYVFSATPSGDRLSNNQVWTGGLPEGVNVSTSLYPDLAQYNDSFIAVTVSNVYDGLYNPTSRDIDWVETNPLAALGGGTVPIGRYLNIASDGNGYWVLLQSVGFPGASYSYTRAGSGRWDAPPSAQQTGPFESGGAYRSALIYNGKYIFGRALLDDVNDDRRVWVGTPNGVGRDYNVTWAPAETNPSVTAIFRFATSNTTTVAVGEYGISYSTDSGSNWTTPPSLPAFISSAQIYDILYAADTWVAVGSFGTSGIAYSSNLSNWEQYTPPVGTPSGVAWSGVAFNANAWTIAGFKTISTPGGYSNQSQILSIAAGPWPNQATSLAVGTISFAPSLPDPRFSRILSASFSNGTPSGSVFIPRGESLTFSQPTQSSFVLYQYVPYTIPILVTGTSDFIFYYAVNVPIGFNFILDATGVSASLSGVSPSNRSAVVSVYAKTANSTPVLFDITLRTILPFFTNPQSGAAAYTAILREHVKADAAQNARDTIVYPQVDPLAGPFTAPYAPDVTTASNCLLSLCKKPCPNCHVTI